jgi:hypothetical protein
MPGTTSLDLVSRLRAWSYHRQRLGHAAAHPLEALRDVVGVYSSHPTAPLAVLARTSGLDAQAFSGLEQRREAVRIAAMRGSLFLVPVEDAPRLAAANPVELEDFDRNLKYYGVTWDDFERLKPRVIESAREPMPPAALQKALGATSEQMVVARLMARQGLILRIGSNLRTDRLLYVATDAWLGHPLEAADPEESLRWLGDRYLRGYGPARIEDLAWWAGITRRDAAAVLAALDTVELADGLLLPAEQREEFERVEPVPRDAIDVLPKWDAYTMGHAPDGRQRLVDDAHLARAYTTKATSGRAGATTGDGLPLLLRGGRAVATWSHRFQGNKLRIEVTPFETLPAKLYAPAFDNVGALLGASAIEVASLAV